MEQEIKELKKANTTLKDAMFFSEFKKEMTKGTVFNFIDKYSKSSKISICNLYKTLGVYERTFYKHKKKVTKQLNLCVILYYLERE